MKTLYLDLLSGLSGDMFVGALLDLGVPFADFERTLAGLGVGGYHLHVGRQSRSGIVGTKFDVHLETDPGPAAHHPHPHVHEPHHAHGHDHGHPRHHHGESGHHTHSHVESHGVAEVHTHGEHRTFADIRQLIANSRLSPWVKDKATRIFERVAQAEGKIHGQPPEAVHFHEVGAIDSIIDIVGACVALDLLGRPRVLASAVVEGTGWVRCAHGRFPVPAPATLEILGARGVAVSQCDEPHELVTPTGAALLAELAETFGPMRGLRAGKIGYGVGTRETKTRPNVLRAVLGEATDDSAAADPHDWETDTVTVLETNLDDISAEILGPFAEMALAAGALDVFHTPVQMKKGRPGVLLTVLSHPADADRLTELMLRETTAFGVRRTLAERRKLRREFRPVTTAFGSVSMKTGLLDGQVVQAAPEFEDCRRLATEAGVPLRHVYAAALAAWQALD